MKWNYTSELKKSTGYEDVYSVLDTYKAYGGKERFNSLDEETQKRVIDEVFNIYRGRNIYPISYFNNKGVYEEIQKCIDKDVIFEGDVLDLKFAQGQTLIKWIQKNMHTVASLQDKNSSILGRFNNDEGLKKAIKFCFIYDGGKVRPSNVLGGLRLSGSTPTNFAPMRVKALLERFCPSGGTYYDFAGGFGGRLLGTLSSKNDYKYIGVEPCTDTISGLKELGDYIEEVTGREDSFELYQVGSEDFCMEENTIDFAFSSPPYFSLEQYSDEDTQCYNKFPKLDEWLEGYVRQTIKNIYTMLKPNCYYAVNIADFKIGSKSFEFVDKWIEISEEEGFEFVQDIKMKIMSRTSATNKDARGKRKDKKEGIFVFKTTKGKTENVVKQEIKVKEQTVEQPKTEEIEEIFF